jgi:Domain of unknown function (DUF4271)
MNQALPRVSPMLAEDWMFPIFVVVLFVIAWVNRDGIVIKNLFKSLVSRRYFKQEERRDVSAWKNFGMLMTFFVMGGLTLELFFERFFASWITWPSALLFVSSVFAVVSIFGLKYLFTLSVASFIGNQAQPLVDYNSYLTRTSKAVAIAMILPLCFSAYFPSDLNIYPIYVSLGLLILVPVLSSVQAALSALQNGVPFFYIFFYLCTFEVLPVALLAKLIVLNADRI